MPDESDKVTESTGPGAAGGSRWASLVRDRQARYGLALIAILVVSPPAGSGLGALLHAAGAPYRLWTDVMFGATGLGMSGALVAMAAHLREIWRPGAARVGVRECRLVILEAVTGLAGLSIAASLWWISAAGA